MENQKIEKDEALKESIRKNNQNAAKKKNILERLEEFERVNSEKDDQIT